MAETATIKKVVTKTPTKPKAPESTKTRSSASDSKNLFAVFTTGGKQYRVQVGDLVKIEKLVGEHKEGDKITFDKVLLTDDGKSDVTLGTPYIKGGEVKATLNKIARYKTIDVIKYKQKSRYFKKYGHRQPYFEVKIDSIT
jgi:large subunit ribosomal protein L21